MRVLLAADKFKGSLRASEVNQLLAEGIRQSRPQTEVIIKPLTDGGEGTARALASMLSMEAREVTTYDVSGTPQRVRIYWLGSRRLALIESASVLRTSAPWSGSDLLRSNSGSLGRLVHLALETRPKGLWIAIGGTLTSDAGWGLASQFGLRAHDAGGALLNPSVANLSSIENLDLTRTYPSLSNTQITLLCDVNAPFHSPGGVQMASFLPQKGASPDLVTEIQAGCTHYIQLLKEQLGLGATLSDPFGAAAGGLMFGLQAVHENTTCHSGSQFHIKQGAFEAAIEAADLVVCGEGALDETTLYGKAPFTLAQACAALHTPCAGVFGHAPQKDFAEKLGLLRCYSLDEHISQPSSEKPGTALSRQNWLIECRKALQSIGREIGKKLLAKQTNRIPKKPA